MYNTKSSSGGSHGNQYIRRIETFRQTQYQLQQLHLQQQQQQTMSNVENCITPKITTPMKNQIQKHAMPLHDIPSQSTCPKPVVQTQILTASITQMSPVNDFENKRIRLEDERSISEKSDVYSIQKNNKEEPNNHLNAQMRRIVSHKNPLMIISELLNDVPIQLQEHSIKNNVTGYTATLEIDGQMSTANHISKTQAKQKACENFLRIMLAKQISERSERKEESHMQIEIEDGENGTVQKPKEHEDFPLLLFASLAMYNLIHQWKLQHVSKAINLQEAQPNVIKSPPKIKANGMKKFSEDPKKYNPVQLLNQMKPGVKFIETIISSKTPSAYQVKCEIDNIPFTGQGSKKKAAKMECCIAAIKYFWQFDFHA
ncbi:uncharacterized protein LOC132938015 [Metopolophium dirhodum]|uniref:uncharacterized protein LOC132938015 n=1 Tax=Metopolophium dirhodum TaxID=44670 RepID=UPI00298FB6F5|nr:uncharacterized protein LOC132938015 [Metopolophium dirhodum]